MICKVSMSDLGRMTEGEKEESFAALVNAARTNGHGAVHMTEARIKEFEVRYEMSSAALLKGLSEGTVRETAEVAEWLFLLSVRQRYVET